MSAQAVIAQARELGVTLTATERGTVRLTSASGKVPVRLAEAVHQHKPDILRALQAPSPPGSLPSTALLLVRSDELACWLCTDERAAAWAAAQGDGVPVLTVTEMLKIGDPAAVPLVIQSKKVFGNEARVVSGSERSRSRGIDQD